MSKKHKHEEHENHERWVISYADMVTLLFALFVVLYALGEVKLKKLQDLKQSLAFAFHFEGSGSTFQPGPHASGDEGGDLLKALMLINGQKGPMREFLLEILPQEFEERTGKSLDVVIKDDTIAFSGPLSGFFDRNSIKLRGDIHGWLTDLVENAHQAASWIRIEIESPKLRIGRVPSTRAPYYTIDLCMERLAHLQSLVSLMGAVAADQIRHEFLYTKDAASRSSWEDVAVITFAFSTQDI